LGKRLYQEVELPACGQLRQEQVGNPEYAGVAREVQGGLGTEGADDTDG